MSQFCSPGLNRYLVLRSHRTACGWTRADVLASLAIGALVCVLMVTSVTMWRNQSQRVQCMGNLGQVDRAILSYASDHGEKLPDSSISEPRDLWWWYKEKVKSYAGLSSPSSTKDLVFACPGDRGYSDPQPFCRSARFDFTSYVFNGVNTLGVPNIAGWQLASVRQPSRTLLVMEWTAHAPLSWHRSRTGRRNAPFYSDAESLVGFVDGHVTLTKIYYDGYCAAYTRDPIPGYEYQYSGK